MEDISASEAYGPRHYRLSFAEMEANIDSRRCSIPPGTPLLIELWPTFPLRNYTEGFNSPSGGKWNFVASHSASLIKLGWARVFLFAPEIRPPLRLPTYYFGKQGLILGSSFPPRKGCEFTAYSNLWRGNCNTDDMLAEIELESCSVNSRIICSKNDNL